MNLDDYREIQRFSAGRVAADAPTRVVLDGKTELPRVAQAVYVAYSPDDVCLYVGSTRRSGRRGAVERRLAEHDRKISRWRTWGRLEIVPIVDGVLLHEVRSIEGYTGMLLRPTQNSRLPRVITLEPMTLVG